jgi:hypothetical protein
MSITFRIGDLAKQAGVKVVTIRYYITNRPGCCPFANERPATIVCTLRSICNA